jgi:hypothetical protein
MFGIGNWGLKLKAKILTVDGVVAEEVDKVVDVHEGVVDGHNLGFTRLLSEGGAEDETADSAETIDTHFDG